MTDTYAAGVTITLVDKVSAGLGQIALAMAKTQTAADALNARMKQIGKVFTSGLIMTAGGAALAAPLVYATNKAMELQTALGRVQIATGASNAQMQMLNDTLTKTANATGIFSKPKLASFAADMYSSGIANVNQINELLPLFAKGADLMKIISHGKISPEDAAHTFSALAHQFGRYSVNDMKPIVEAAVAIAPSLPGGLRTLKGMGSYANIIGNRMLGIDPVQMMALEAAIAQTSGGQGTGRGALSGANLINALKRAMPGVFGSGLLEGRSAFSAEVLGLAKGGLSTVFDRATGKMSLDKLIDTLSSFEKLSGPEMARRMLSHADMLGKKAPEERAFLQNFLKTPGAPKAQLIANLLQSQGGSASTILQLFGDEKFKGLLKSIQDRVKASKGIEAMQEEAMKMLEPQLLRVQTNFDTLAATIGMHMIPVVTLVATKLGDFLDKLNGFAQAHPRIVQAAVSLMALASAALLLGGGIRLIQAGFMGLQLLGGPVGKAIWGAVTGFKLFTPQGLAITAAIIALTVAVKNWDKIVEFAKQHVDWLKVGLVALCDFADMAGKAIGWLAKQLGGFVNGVLGMLNLPQIQLGKVDSGVLDYANKRLGQMGMLKDIDNWAKTGAKPPPPLFVPPPLPGGGGKHGGHVTQHNVFNVQQVPGHDHEKCLRTLTKGAQHTAYGASGNSVGRPMAAKGNYRS